MTDNRWLILAVLFLARSSMGFQFQSVASTAPFLTRSFAVGYTEIGALIGLYMLPGIVFALPGGLLGKRFGDKRVCAAGLVLMILGGIIFALSASYGTAFAGRLVSGIGAVLFNLVLTKMVTDWFAGREIITAMGVILASWPFGIATALIIEPLLAEAQGWPCVMAATAALCAVVLTLVAVIYRAPSSDAAKTPATEVAVRPGGLPLGKALPAAAAGLIWGVFNLGLIVFFSFVPGLLAERGASLAEAGALVSFGLWTSLLALPLGGLLVERSGRPQAAIVLFSTLAALVMLLLAHLPYPAMLCALLGIMIGPPAGPIMALPSLVLSAEQRALGLGVFYTMYYAVMAGGPLLAGYCRDAWGSAAAAVVYGGLMFAIVLPLFLLFKGLATRPPGLRITG